MNTRLTSRRNVWMTVGALLLLIMLAFGYSSGPTRPVSSVATTTPVAVVTTATTTPLVQVDESAVAVPAPVPQKPPVAPATPKPPVVTPPAPPVVPPPRGSVGTTTLAVQSIPLLSGGTVGRTGRATPVVYLQITNVGTQGAVLKGFWVIQNGTASVDAVIGLLTVDDQGGSRGRVGGIEGETPFQHNTAFAPTDAYFKPGQMRLFTIKAELARDLSSYAGTDLKIDVTGLESGATIQGVFPIRGTTWTIGP